MQNYKHSVEIDLLDAVSSLTREEQYDFIVNLDLKIAEVDFTERLIIHLVESLATDLSGEEYYPYHNLLNAIKN